MARRSFALDIRAFAEKSKNRATTVVKKVGIDFGSSLVLGTPVDTGHARHNWQIGFGTPKGGELSGTDQDGSATVGRIIKEISANAKFGTTLYFTNNVSYIIPLEYGHSKQAPSGMVRITVARFQSFVNAAVNEAKKEHK